MADRREFMAGNWKMNMDHLQATHLVQKLAWLLSDAKHDYSDVEVAVIVPFTALRSVQTLIRPTNSALNWARRTSPSTPRARTPATSAPRCLPR